MRGTEHLDCVYLGWGREGNVGSLLAVVSDGTVRLGGLSLLGDLGPSNLRVPKAPI